MIGRMIYSHLATAIMVHNNELRKQGEEERRTFEAQVKLAKHRAETGEQPDGSFRVWGERTVHTGKTALTQVNARRRMIALRKIEEELNEL